jgi:DNA-binding NtrC family response regulator
VDDPIRLLIVDDEADFLAALAERLRLRGLEVTTAPDGAGALALVGRRRFDVALVDLKLPDLDGDDLLPRLKDTDPDLEVVILTGHPTLESAVDCTKLGAYAYLPKPYDLDGLLTVLRDAYAERLERRYAAREEAHRLHLEQLLEAVQGESPLGVLRRIRGDDGE